jgi:DNA-binding NtrC family response regulator
MWRLRRELAFFAARPGHALLVGPSGSGKELCARALHGLSARKNRPFVARSAATLPQGIIDAELFGNLKNYPNPGMRERQGLVGAADEGTLFLDEIGELPEELQAHLLRLLDSGEYHRLGEEHPRRADLRFVGATNREEESLKHDLAARLTLRIAVPGFDERRGDIPLLLRSMLRRLASTDAAVAARFFDGDEARLDPFLVEALLRHSYLTHVRELELLLMLAMANSHDRSIRLGPEVEARLRLPRPRRDPPGREEIEAALLRTSNNMSRAWVELGLSSRDVLYRLIKKYGISTPGRR